MSYVLAALGFVALIILHEFGHFIAAKSVGMRVERFSLFFGPLLVKFRRGETEYGIAPIPLGGYVRISGMNPNERLPEEVLPRAYYNQPVWKRIVVILAGPVMNLLIAFVIVWALFMSQGQSVPGKNVAVVQKGTPAAAVLRPSDEIVSVDGVSGSETAIRNQIGTHTCAGAQVNGCKAATPAKVVVRRDGKLYTFEITPRYNVDAARPLLGFEFGSVQQSVGAARAASLSVTGLWGVTRQTVGVVGRIFEPRERKQLSGIVGGYTVTQESFATSTTDALKVLALISLSLAIINLFPFLPLDGGHIFWAVAEKVRGKRIPFAVMERAGIIGFALILLLFVIGLSNDISTLSGKGFNIH
ncbi:MAG TPA: site-2 protease family protein [Solirubrobacteraceae bacterium]|nr:site-2 protease family protein [Solirubrobacteraceae bacterium]